MTNTSITAVAHEGFAIQIGEQRGHLAIVDETGRVIEAGTAVESAAWENELLGGNHEGEKDVPRNPQMAGQAVPTHPARRNSAQLVVSRNLRRVPGDAASGRSR